MTYSIKDIALMLGVRGPWVAQRIKTGELEAIEVGVTYRVTRAAYEKFLEARAKKLRDDIENKRGKFASKAFGGPQYVAGVRHAAA